MTTSNQWRVRLRVLGIDGKLTWLYSVPMPREKAFAEVAEYHRMGIKADAECTVGARVDKGAA